MTRLSLLSRRLASHSRILRAVREMSPAKAWALGLGIAGSVTLFAVSFRALDSYISPASPGEQAVGLSDGDGTLAYAFYSAGLTQDLGTFGALPSAGAAGSGSVASADGLFSSSSASSAPFLYTGGDVQAIDALYGAYNLGRDISSARHMVGSSNAAFAASHSALRSSGGLSGGGYGGGGGHGSGGGSSGPGLSGSGALAGEISSTDSPHSGDALALAASEVKKDVSASVRGSDEDAKTVASVFAADDDLLALPFSEEAALAGGVGAEVAELFLAKGMNEAGESLGTIQAAVLDDQGARVPDFTSTWALFAVAFAGMAVLRRFPA